MKRVWMAEDGNLYYKAKYCKEYEKFLHRAQEAVRGIHFRDRVDGTIIQHDRGTILHGWTCFLKVVESLVEWDTGLRCYSAYPGDPPQDIQPKCLRLLEKFRKLGKNNFPVSIRYRWPGIGNIVRKFESINFSNGEEYCGSFGMAEDRKGYLNMYSENNEKEE